MQTPTNSSVGTIDQRIHSPNGRMERQCSPLIGPPPLDKRHKLQPHNRHRDEARSEVNSFSMAVGDLPRPGLAGRCEPPCY